MLTIILVPFILESIKNKHILHQKVLVLYHEISKFSKERY